MKTIAVYNKSHVVCSGRTYGLRIFTLYFFFSHDPCNWSGKGIQEIEWSFAWGDISWHADVNVPHVYDGRIGFGVTGEVIGKRMFT